MAQVKAMPDDDVPTLLESEASPKKFRKHLRSIHIIAFIEDEQLIKKILESAVGGWDVKRKPAPRANVVHPPLEEPAA